MPMPEATDLLGFSEAIDLAIRRSGRLDRRDDMVSYLNLTMRECQNMAYFFPDLVEDVVDISGHPAIWTYPRLLRRLKTCKYTRTGFDDVWPKKLSPGRAQRNEDYYFYAASNYYAFYGVNTGQSVAVAYYTFFQRLRYYEVGARPATYDQFENTWTYLPEYDVDDDTRELARSLVSNWLIERFFDCMIEGTLAKVYKNVGDARAQATYGLYKSLESDIKVEVGSEELGD